VWNAGCEVEGDGDVVGGGAGGQADGIVVFAVPERVLMLCWRSSLSPRRAVVNAPGNLLVGRGGSDTSTTKQPLPIAGSKRSGANRQAGTKRAVLEAGAVAQTDDPFLLRTVRQILRSLLASAFTRLGVVSSAGPVRTEIAPSHRSAARAEAVAPRAMRR
jgi:hypothetical protein